MYYGSDEFNKIIDDTTGTALEVRLTLADNTVIENIKNLKYNGGSNSSDSLSIGTTNMAYLEMEVENLNVTDNMQCALSARAMLSNGTYEEMPIGIFTLQAPKGGDDVVVKAVDNMCRLEREYISSLTFPTTTDNILDEICTICQVAGTGTLPYSITIQEKPQGYTCREMVGYIAGLYGRFVCFDRFGLLNIRWYDTTNKTPKKTDVAWEFEAGNKFAVGKVTMDVDIETSYSTGDGTTGITHSNPFATQEIVDGVYDKLNGFQYNPVTIKMLDDIRLDPWDVLEITDEETGNIYDVPVMELYHNFTDLYTTVEATALSENESEYDYSGPTTQTIKRMSSEIYLLKYKSVEQDKELGTLKTKQSELSATVDGFQAEVSEKFQDYSTTEETKTLIEQSAKEINLSVEKEISNIQIGGINLIRNSAELTGSGTGWAWGNVTGIGKIRKLLEGSENIYGMYIERSGLTVEAYTQFQYTHGNATNRTLNVGDTFTASVWYYCDSTKTKVDGRGLSFSIQSFNTDNVQVNGSYGKYITPESVVYDKWTRIESTFTITQNAEYYIRLVPNLYLNGNVIFTKPQLETGTKATSYAPSPDDANAKLVNLESQAVGGRNLLLKTATAFEIEKTSDFVSINKSKQYSYSPVVTNDPKAFLLSLKDGQAMCLSFDIDFPRVYNNASVTGLSYSRVGASFGFKVTHTDGTSKTWYGTHSGPSVLTNKDNLGINSLQSLTSTETSVVGHYAGYTIPTKATNLIDFYANPDDYTVEVITPFVDCRAYTTGGTIKNLMLEVGTMPSEWQEAPEEKVSTDKIISAINLSEEGVKIQGPKIQFEGTVTANENFKILEDGSMEAKNGSFTGDVMANGKLGVKFMDSSGNVIESALQIEDGTINQGSLVYDDGTVIMASSAVKSPVLRLWDATKYLVLDSMKIVTFLQCYSAYFDNLQAEGFIGINVFAENIDCGNLLVQKSLTYANNTDWQAIRGTSIQSAPLAEPSVGNELKYRRHNGKVEVKGNIGLSAYAANYTLFTLPEEYRATTSNVRYHMCAATANYIARVRYNPGTGIFVCEWIADFVTGAHPTTGSAVAWFSLDIEYPLD